MAWKKTSININDLPAFINELTKHIKAGDDIIEKMRCVYQIKNLDIIQCLMPYDFLDGLDDKPEIVQLNVYQLLD